MAGLLALPLDLLVLITPLLDTQSFLALTSTCSTLHSSAIVEDWHYWSTRVRRDFRVPNQPVVASDGRRWMKLYKRLSTQTRAFTWGKNDKQCLSRQSPLAFVHSPQPMDMVDGLGVISDLQCGGWSISLLTAKGALYTIGALDGLTYGAHQHSTLQPLLFPPGLPQPAYSYDQRTAVRAFSVGRDHVLALSDSGSIWSWTSLNKPASKIKFLHHDTFEDGREKGRSVVRKVVAGWNKSAALIEGTGLVVWEPFAVDPDCDQPDATLVLDSVVVPRTAQVDGAKKINEESPADAVGEVQSIVVLEHAILYNTSLGKVFASAITWTDEVRSCSDSIELNIPTSLRATDIQGSFRNFAVFLDSGAVLTSTQDVLMSHITTETDIPGSAELWTRIPALQDQGVISLAFGDYHFHALHAPGYVTSFGHEPGCCGALGFGRGDSARLRGVRNIRGEGYLVPDAYTHGRRVWFDRVKHEWLESLIRGDANPEEAAERLRMARQDQTSQGEISQWIEEQAISRFDHVGSSTEPGEDGLAAHFVLSIAAAGWHSGALVLVNEELESEPSDGGKSTSKIPKGLLKNVERGRGPKARVT